MHYLKIWLHIQDVTHRAWKLVPRFPVNLHWKLFLCPNYNLGTLSKSFTRRSQTCSHLYKNHRWAAILQTRDKKINIIFKHYIPGPYAGNFQDPRPQLTYRQCLDSRHSSPLYLYRGDADAWTSSAAAWSSHWCPPTCWCRRGWRECSVEQYLGAEAPQLIARVYHHTKIKIIANYFLLSDFSQLVCGFI